MNILITGGAGFIGSNLTDKLLVLGHRVICIDNFDSFYNPEIKRNNIKQALEHDFYTLVEGDIRDAKVLDNIFKTQAIDIVVHLAARAGVRPSIEQPELYYDVNVTGTLTILEAMRRHHVTKMAFASSSSVYGNNDKVPFAETDFVDNPISPYAASKKAGELMCYTYSHLYNFDISCLRFFTVYGPRQRPEMAISLFTNNILNKKPIKMFGDGLTKRDYTYIDDIVQGVERVIENLSGYEVYNLGESQTISLADLVYNIEQAIGTKAIIEQHPMQSGDVNITFADISKAKQKIGYNPTTNIYSGIKKYVDWVKENK